MSEIIRKSEIILYYAEDVPSFYPIVFNVYERLKDKLWRAKVENYPG